MPVVAAYPTLIPNFTTKVDDVDTVFADHVNILQAEVRAIASTLGTLPAGSAATVRARMQAVEDGLGIISSRFDSGGLIPQAGVVGLASALAAVAGTGVVLPAWTSFAPVVRFGTTAATYTSPSSALGAYKLVGKTLYFGIDVPVAAGLTPASSGTVTVDLPAGVTSIGRAQPVSCLFRVGTPPTGYPIQNWTNQLVQPSVNNLSLFMRSNDGVSSAWVTNTHGLAELYVNGVIEIA